MKSQSKQTSIFNFHKATNQQITKNNTMKEQNIAAAFEGANNIAAATIFEISFLFRKRISIK